MTPTRVAEYSFASKTRTLRANILNLSLIKELWKSSVREAVRNVKNPDNNRGDFGSLTRCFDVFPLLFQRLSVLVECKDFRQINISVKKQWVTGKS